MSKGPTRVLFGFSLKWLLLCVAYVGIVCAGLVSGTNVWAEIVSTISVATLIFALLSVLFGSPQYRPIWGSYLIAASIYLALTVYPGGHSDFFPTTRLLRELHDQLGLIHAERFAQEGFTTRRWSNNRWVIQTGPNQTFPLNQTWPTTERIGHCVFGMAFGLLAAAVGYALAKRRHNGDQ
jgi:hypothetical protein